MIWVKKDSEGNRQVWYSEDIIDKIKETLNKRPYHTIEKVLKMIEEAENGKIKLHN